MLLTLSQVRLQCKLSSTTYSSYNVSWDWQMLRCPPILHRLPTSKSHHINFLFQAQSKHSKLVGGHFRPNPGQFVVTSHETLLNKWLNTTTTAATTTRSTAMRGEHHMSQMQIWSTTVQAYLHHNNSSKTCTPFHTATPIKTQQMLEWVWEIQSKPVTVCA